MKTKLTGLGGSLSAKSTSLAALRIAIDAAADAGAETELFDIRELDLPMYAPGVAAPAAVERLCDAIYKSDGMIWSSPLYHGTISGSFKNALDWLQLLSKREPAYLTDKVVGLISTAGGTQGLQAVNTMEFVVRALRGWAVPLVIPIAKAWEVFDEQGHTADNAVCQQLTALGREVARAAAQFAHRTMTTPEAVDVEKTLQPLTRADAT
jgi:FMN reductase